MYKLSESVEIFEIGPMGAKLCPFEGGGCLSPLSGGDKQNLEVALL